MSPLMRLFTLIGIALAVTSMQLKARAEPAGAADSSVRTEIPAQPPCGTTRA